MVRQAAELADGGVEVMRMTILGVSKNDQFLGKKYRIRKLQMTIASACTGRPPAAIVSRCEPRPGAKAIFVTAYPRRNVRYG